MRIAYCSPLPPERSGIADYSALLLPALRERIDVEVVAKGARSLPRGVDAAVYHIGNNPEAHGWILELVRRQPSLVVLHELVVHHLIAGLTVGRGDREGYLAAMQREAGTVGRLLAHGVFDGLVPPPWEARPQDFPLVREVLPHARGLIVHSAYVERAARSHGYAGPIWRVPHPAWPVPAVHDDPALPAEATPVIGCFGYLNASKRVPQLLAAFARVATELPSARLLVVGAARPELRLGERIAQLGLEERVVLLDHVDEQRLWALLQRCDVVVGLRSPTMGETSGIALRALSAGRPLVVSDVGWFSELPDDVAVKVAPDEWEIPLLAEVLVRLGGDAELRRAMSAAGLAAARGHDVAHVADAYVAAVEACAGAEGVELRVLEELARAAAEVGIAPTGPEVALLGARARDVLA